MPADLQEWLENNTREATSVRIRVGERANPSTVACIIVADAIGDEKFPSYDPIHVDSWEECHDAILQTLEGAGWGTEPGQECARVHVYGDTGQQQKTWSRVRQVENAVTAGVDTSVLLSQELIRMAGEMRRSFGVVCGALADQSQGREDAITEMIQAHRAQIESQAHAELVQVLAESEAGVEEPTDPLQNAAAGILQGIAGQFLPVMGESWDGAAARVSARDLVIQTLKSDPGLVSELMSDPEVLQALSESVEAEAPAEPMDLAPENDVIPPETPPSPMPE